MKVHLGTNDVSVASASVAPLPGPYGSLPSPMPCGLHSEPCGSSALPGISTAPVSKHFIIGPLTRAQALEIILCILATLGATEGFLGRDRHVESSQCTAHVTSPEAHLAQLSRKRVLLAKECTLSCLCQHLQVGGPGTQAEQGG